MSKLTDYVKSFNCCDFFLLCRTIDALTGVNGQQLFALQKSDPQRFQRCDKDDARKLKNHLLLEKNRSGYETPSIRQLKAVLAMRQQKVADQLEAPAEDV